MKKLFTLLIISSLAYVSCNEGTENQAPATSDSAESVTEPVIGNPPLNPTDTMLNIDSTSPSVSDATDTAVH